RDRAADEADRERLELRVVLDGAVVPAGHGDEAGAGRGDMQRAGMLDGDDLVALGVEEQQRRVERHDRRQLVVVGQDRPQPAASPSARQARANAKSDSSHERAPCSTTTLAIGSDAGRKRAYASPSSTPSSAGGSTLTVSIAWHDPRPMAALQQFSPVFPIGSR